tara:strand:+ start:153 stop:617 length:465 start_codon:yes stop_codon:yes gene_type:complete
MIESVGAIMAGVSMATKAIKAVADTGGDIQRIAGYVGQLGAAQAKLSAMGNKNNKITSAGEAIQAALAKKQVDDQMTQIKDMFMVSGNGMLWDQIQRDLAQARKNELAEIKRQVAARRRLIKNIKMVGGALLATIISIPILVISIVKGLELMLK